MNSLFPSHERHKTNARARIYRQHDPHFAEWAKGCGVITHDPLTQVRIHDMVSLMVESGLVKAPETAYRRLAAADRIANAAMWLVVHMTYANRVYTDGRALAAADFKTSPQGHTGGALNMVIGYVAYLAANALDGVTRSWLMGQGHCVAAIDAVNLIMDNMSPAQTGRYEYSDAGATAFVRDVYAYDIGPDGLPLSPLGSHVNPHTAGGLIEGGYLGFAELLYAHMPLPGERLVAFLSDGAFEEQRGSDWAARWWRAEDCGLVAPIMVANGRRIDQRSSMAQNGGVNWFRQHLALNGFDPIDIDGRDPASYVWALFEIESRLATCAKACLEGSCQYPAPLYYGIAETEKGFGFPGAGTNAAHNLPLGGNPATDRQARELFNQGAEKLFVLPDRLKDAVGSLSTHTGQGRPKERDHPLVRPHVPDPKLPEPLWQQQGEASASWSPMQGIDQYFCDIVQANPALRPRVGNPDEMRSNQLGRTLDLLKHRVSSPEQGVAESVDGKVITALNEEAVVCAALGNKGGINLVCTYEAFGVKMLGALRQDIIFARHQKLVGQSPGWLGVPVILTSHTWENGKNEQSHQDPTLAEALMGEMADVSRVVFPPDWNSAQTVLRQVYRSHGTIWGLVIPKRPQPQYFSPAQAERLATDGAVRVRGSGDKAEKLLLVATGACQLAEALKASGRLADKGVRHAVVYLQEPGRFRLPRDTMEETALAPLETVSSLFPDAAAARIFVTHTRAAAYAGTVRPLDTGPATTYFMGYANRGGTLDTNGLLFANGCSWAHIVCTSALALGLEADSLLTDAELAALKGAATPEILWHQSDNRSE